MTIPNEIHEFDIGTVFQVEFWDTKEDKAIDISEAEEIKIIFQFADKSAKIKEATPPEGSDGKDGIAEYVSVENDLTPAGVFKWQGFIKLPTGQWKSSITKDVIHPNLTNGI